MGFRSDCAVILIAPASADTHGGADGHELHCSWGRLLARMFVELYPSEVRGLVYIDPTDTRTLADESEYYREQGYVGAAMVERKASLLRFSGADRGEFKVLVDTVQSGCAK